MQIQPNLTTSFSNLYALRKAIEDRDSLTLDGLLSRCDNLEAVTASLRSLLANYRVGLDDVSYEKCSKIWAVPVVLADANNFITTEGVLHQIFNSASRKLVRKYFGLQYEVAAYDGLIHSDMLSSMSVMNQVDLMSLLVSSDDKAEKSPFLRISDELSSRITSGNQPELAFMLGSATRYQIQPEFPTMQPWHQEFKTELAGHIAIHSKNNVSILDSIICGVPLQLEEALVFGYKKLISQISQRYKLLKPTFSVIDPITYALNVPCSNQYERFTRKILMKASLLSVEAMADVYEYACTLVDAQCYTEPSDTSYQLMYH